MVEYRADRIAATATTVNGGRSPGWTVSIDGEPAESLVDHEMFRAVDVPAGTHAIVWLYRPQSLLYGAAVSAITFVLLAALAHVRYWNPRRLRWLEDKESNR